MSTGCRLSVYSAAFNFSDYVKLTFLLDRIKWSFHSTNGLIETKIVCQLLIVDLYLAFTFNEANTSRGGFAPASS